MRFFIISILLLFFSPIAQAQELPSDDEIMAAYMEEAEHFQAYCDSQETFRRYYNCECLAASFLESRIERGPDASRSSIMMMIEGDCQDAAEGAAQAYGNCIGNTLLLPNTIDPEAYCNCVGNQFAKYFEVGKAVPGPQAMISANTRAHTVCRRPGFAESQYTGSQ